MPTVTTNLRVFLSSPGDLAKEREIFKSVVEEINRILSGSEVRLELLMWETNTVPSIGKDPQSIINEQIGDDYDIFVGVMWTRFGTSTPRAGSGTEEEFNRAYERLISNPTQSRILFYFKDAPPVSLSSIDPQQFEKVYNFKEHLKAKGLLGIYQSTDDFAGLVRPHLLHHINEFRKTWGFDSSAPDPKVKSTHTPETDNPVVEEDDRRTRHKQEEGIKVFPSKKVYARINADDADDDARKEFTVRYPIIEGIKSESILYKINAVLSYERVFGVSLAEAIEGEMWIDDLDYTVNFLKRPFMDLTFIMEGIGAYPWQATRNIVINYETGERVKATDLFNEYSLERLALIVNEFVQVDLKKASLEELYKYEEIQLDVVGENPLIEGMEERASWIEERFSSKKFSVENLNDFSLSDSGIYFIYDFEFPHVIKALEPEGRYYFPYATLKQGIKKGGMLDRFIRENSIYD
jgi:hypothetical protein